MNSESGRYSIVFNGEIYNHLEFRDREHTFRGHSDTESLLRALDRWGLRATLPRLIGMFAFALWDAAETKLYLVRDRLGIKPLYYVSRGGGVTFASELKALIRAGACSNEIDADRLADYLRLLFVPPPETLIRGVRQVAPGHLVEVSAGGAIRSEAYWSLQTIAREERSRPLPNSRETVEEFEALLRDATRLRLLADVPVGTLLSGGVDSTLVTALAARESATPLKTFSVAFDVQEHDESAHARAIADYLGTDHTEFRALADDALEIVEELGWLMDEPLADPSLIPTFQISREARKNVTVALAGDGGDEFFAGYNRYAFGSKAIPVLSHLPAGLRRLAARILAPPSVGGTGTLHDPVAALLTKAGVRLPQQKIRKLRAILEEAGESDMYASLLSPWYEAAAPSTGDPAVRDRLRTLWDNVPDWPLTEKMMLADQLVYLPGDLLTKVDRASMATSLEVRVPLLDHRVVEYSWRLPLNMKLRGRETKWVLRQVLDRYVPRELVDRPKTGFTVPIESWLRGPLKAWGYDMINTLPDDVGLDAKAVRQLWLDFQAGRNQSGLAMWTLVAFAAWRNRWFA